MATITPTIDAGQLFEQALRSYETALKSGIGIQQEQVKRFTDMLGQFSSPHEWLEKTQAVINDAIPNTRKNVDEITRVVQQNSTTCLELLEKACAASRCTSMSDAQAKTRELWEASLGALRANAQAAVQANSRLLESLADLVKTDGGQAADTQEEQPTQESAKP